MVLGIFLVAIVADTSGPDSIGFALLAVVVFPDALDAPMIALLAVVFVVPEVADSTDALLVDGDFVGLEASWIG